jgi:YVTN family beta-propeller protein
MRPAKTVRLCAGVSNDISVIDLEDMEVTRSVTVGSCPWGVASKE